MKKTNNNKEEKADMISSKNKSSWHMSQKIKEFMHAKGIREINFDYNKLKRKIDLNEKLKESVVRVAERNKRTYDIALNLDGDSKIIIANEEYITFVFDELIQYVIENSKPGKIVIIGLISIIWNEILFSINDFGENPHKPELDDQSYQKVDLNSTDEDVLLFKVIEKIMTSINGELNIYKKQIPGTMIMIRLNKYIE